MDFPNEGYLWPFVTLLRARSCDVALGVNLTTDLMSSDSSVLLLCYSQNYTFTK